MKELNLIEIFSIIIIHWVADFVFQTDKMAKGKSKNWIDLLNHTFLYGLIWTSVGCLYVIKYCFNYDGIINLMEFTIITILLHTIQDYFTSRLNSKLWEQGKIHYFFVSIGFDQVLHYIQLFTTYYFLKAVI